MLRLYSLSFFSILTFNIAVPTEKKKIKPIDVGGFAGGLKFIVQNILFKFAIDHMDLYRTNFIDNNGIDKRRYGSDEAAAKVAGHDLRGLTHYFECGIEDLCVPLTMLLDYRGFRLICQVLQHTCAYIFLNIY